ncbi:MAG: N-acetyl-gamma-glutamyl-phosphate reductase [Aestuariibacter sp.]
MLKTCIFGASGYTGVELAILISRHPEFALQALFVSEHSKDAGKTLKHIDSRLQQPLWQSEAMRLQAAAPMDIADLVTDLDIVFLCTPHEFSHDIVSQMLATGVKVMDLSGAFRLKNSEQYPAYYGFEHQFPALLNDAVYGLVEWQKDKLLNAQLVAVPGCYPTASLLALLPLVKSQFLDSSVKPVINATSGVSGAGRKATMTNSLCEVSLQAYGVHQHRHQPEISGFLKTDVIFTPHLGAFKRGILATITVKVNAGVSELDIQQAFEAAYHGSDVIKLTSAWPKIDDVVNSACCHLHWQLNPEDNYLVVSSAIDNLLKGAASQALQCANLSCGFDDSLGLEGIL